MQKSEKENAGSVMKVSSNMLFFNSFYVNALFMAMFAVYIC